MVAKRSTVIKTEMQSRINTQRRYCADPRLDRTRDASLKHQRKHGAARKQLRFFFCSFFFAFFFGCPDQKSGFRARKVAMMGSVSKRVSRPKKTMGENFFYPRIFGLKSAL